MITQDQLIKALEKEPDLTREGLDSKHTDRFESKRNELLGCLRQVDLCCQWLSLCKQRQSINKKVSSYGLKHYVERYFGEYVSNGDFIAALIVLGIRYERIPYQNLNVFTCLSNKLPEDATSKLEKEEAKEFRRWRRNGYSRRFRE